MVISFSPIDEILGLLGQDRKIYGRLLLSNKEKIRNYDAGKVDSSREIVQRQIGWCDLLLLSDSRSSSSLTKLLLAWKDSHRIGSSDRDAYEKIVPYAREGIARIDVHIRELKVILQSQIKEGGFDASLFKAEKETHEKIRRSFFLYLRVLMDLLKNIDEKKPLIYVVVPAYNEEKHLTQTLRRVMNQTYPNKKVVVVDNASKDGTSHLARKYTPEVIYTDKRGVGFARNIGAQYAIEKGAEIVVFLDADSSMRKDLLEKVWEAVYFEGVLAGISRSQFDQDHLRAKTVQFLHNLNRVVFKIPHTFMFAKKEVVQKVSFIETNELGEDVKWAHDILGMFGFRRFKVITDSWVITSARRFEKKGYFSVVSQWASAWPFGLVSGKKVMDYFEE